MAVVISNNIHLRPLILLQCQFLEDFFLVGKIFLIMSSKMSQGILRKPNSNMTYTYVL